MTIKDYWRTFHGYPGFLSDRNLDPEILISAGLAEVQEDVFEFTVENQTESEIVARMIEAGFGYSDAFVKFVKGR